MRAAVYLSQTFRTAWRWASISRPLTLVPLGERIVERSFDSGASLFAQYVAGYVGGSAGPSRGKDADQTPRVVDGNSGLLGEWIVAHWQNRPWNGRPCNRAGAVPRSRLDWTEGLGS